MDRTEVDAKLSAARMRLILDNPFLGALVLRLPLLPTQGDWCPTTGTDARRLFYNPAYVSGLSVEETQFVLAHEALHCALAHFARRGHRVKRRWDLACDYAINALLVESGLQAPPGVLWNVGFAGMSAEEIYPYIQEDAAEEPLDQHLYDGSQGEQGEQGGNNNAEEPAQEQAGAQQAPPALSPSERETLAAQWRERLAGAAQQAMQAGKLPGTMARLVEGLLQPALPWRALLARYVSAAAREDYSYTRPSARRGDPAVFPSLRSSSLELLVALDTSGSVSEGELREFLTEVDAIKGQVRARLTLQLCDAGLAPDGPWHFEPWEEARLPRRLPGGGGTRFTPVFEWVERQDMRPELLIYFTDGQGEFPAREPDYPVLWLIKGNAQVPWGQRIQLN